jgi:hypothetical protein
MTITHIKSIAGWVLVAFSAFIFYQGTSLYYAMWQGEARSTEYLLLFVLAYQMSGIMIWLALFAVWVVLPAHRSALMLSRSQDTLNGVVPGSEAQSKVEPTV